MSTCCCTGPRPGEPLCPCQMRAVNDYGERSSPYDTRKLFPNSEQYPRRDLTKSPYDASGLAWKSKR